MSFRDWVHRRICNKRVVIYVIMQCDRCLNIRADDVFPEGGTCDYIRDDKLPCNGKWHKVGGIRVEV